jgi:MoaA/NifB/PqqE/SkfB family radical SAM enzyme
MFNLESIDEYQIEITSYCNAACPQCPRNNYGVGINPIMPLRHLERNVIDRAFPKELCLKLRQIFFCGSYGDPIMHSEFLDILQDFRNKNPTLWLYVHTNGGVHDEQYWQQMAKIMNGYGQVDFGIDGLEDTLHLYRRNVSYDHVITNARAFINANGRAQWNFIVFKHNQHQVDEAKKRAKELGFFNILVRKTGRFFHHETVTELDHWPVYGKNGLEYELEPPTDTRYQNQSMMFLPALKKEYPNIKVYFDNTEIKCDALMGKKVAINADGLVLPCNFFNHNLYDRRFYENNWLPGCNSLSNTQGKNQVRSFLESYGLDLLNINYCNLKDIFSNSMWNDLINSWQKKLDAGRLFECAMTCGSKLTKVWDQGGNNR